MTGSPHSRPVVAAVAMVVAVTVAISLGAAGCAGDGEGDDGAGPVAPTTEAPTPTTVDPLAGPVADACGNDLSGLTSTVWGIDPAAGEVRWSTTVPLAEAFVLRDDGGDPRLSLVLRPVEAVVDADSGAVVGYPSAGVHEVLVDPAGDPRSGVAGLTVDGEPQPVVIEVGGLRITTAAGQTGQTTIGLTATDALSSAPAWRVDLGAADEVAAVSAPVVFGDTVVVVTASPRPSCDPS